jgi:hypothetical protein
MTAIVSMALCSCHISIDENYFGGGAIKGNGNIVMRDYNISTFDELSCDLPATVNFSVSDDYTCIIRVDENLHDYLDVKVSDGELWLSKSEEHRKVNLRATKFVIDVTAPSLEKINLVSSGDINVISPLNETKLDVSIVGSGNVTFTEEVNIDHLELTVAGSGDIAVEKGSVAALEADVIGSGDVVSKAEVQDLDVNVTGSGDVTAKVNGKLDYYIIGSGDIHYYGDAKVSGKIAGSGSINRIESSSM